MIRGLLRRQTLASFDYQWRELPEGGGLLSDEWFNDNAARIISEELLCLRADWFRGKRILDAGCGSGRWTVGLLRLGADVVATDVSEHALGYARENVATLCSTAQAARFEAVRANLFDLPAELRTERFDCVFSFGVLHHTGDTTTTVSSSSTSTAGSPSARWRG
jgi:2-polyprenyl-3-methyl-5-hydroxy-6-metoxy-1,4-benzoquinol methylase